MKNKIQFKKKLKQKQGSKNLSNCESAMGHCLKLLADCLVKTAQIVREITFLEKVLRLSHLKLTLFSLLQFPNVI